MYVYRYRDARTSHTSTSGYKFKGLASVTSTWKAGQLPDNDGLTPGDQH